MRAALLLLGLVGCVPELIDRPSLLDRPRVLAVVAEPPEVRPGGNVAYRALIAGPAGEVSSPELEWSFCTIGRPLTENGSISSRCLQDATARAPISGAGRSITAATPTDACVIFGPNPPPGNFRPPDPDPSGGFFQPLLLLAPALEVPSVALERVTCELPDTSLELSRELRERYHANQNPRIISLKSLDPSGARQRVELRWAPQSIEDYVVYDRSALTLVDRLEAFRVSWFVTGGSLELDHSGADEGDLAALSGNVWTGSAAAILFAVLRDSRGGTATASIALVAP